MINKIEKFFVDILIKIKRKYKYHQLKKFYKIKDDFYNPTPMFKVCAVKNI